MIFEKLNCNCNSCIISVILDIHIKVGSDSTYLSVDYKLKQWFPFLENTPTIEGENVESDDDKPATGKTGCHCIKTYI